MGVSQVKEQPVTVATAPLACNRTPLGTQGLVKLAGYECGPSEAWLWRHVKLNTVQCQVSFGVSDSWQA
ncbi:Hypothetical protein SMAX5B_021394 [Scophthalmus maximus]|uniref:Uncharacterized protein n=1 Tax=Scophthalmus maximus TaxID=52904 RepID=A0A2U9B1L3_SCOMX|nr:Hypothetical protein SMAX5B_021394 [Scophthalmus maximus]